MKRELKGKSIIDFPCDYTVIDTAATSYFLGNEIADQFCSLMRPDDLEYAADMTHHTKAELAAAPFPIDVFKKFKEFIGNDILVGHNVSFDINFIYNLPENEDNLTLKGNKSSKLIKAEKMIEDGKDLTILSENLFYDMLEEYNQGNE